jgi:hypothetical protein
VHVQVTIINNFECTVQECFSLVQGNLFISIHPKPFLAIVEKICFLCYYKVRHNKREFIAMTFLYDIDADEIMVKIVLPDPEIPSHIYTRKIKREIIYRGRKIDTPAGRHVIECITPKSGEGGYLKVLHLVDIPTWEEMQRSEKNARRKQSLLYLLGGVVLTVSVLFWRGVL